MGEQPKDAAKAEPKKAAAKTDKPQPRQARQTPAEPVPATEAQLAGQDDSGPAVMLNVDESGEGQPLSEAELSGQKAD